MSEPRTEYDARLATRRAAFARLEKRDEFIANVRLGIFGVGAAMGIGALAYDTFPAYWLTLPGVAFVAVLIVHDVVIRQKKRAQTAVDFYLQALRRMDGTWPGTGVSGDDHAPADHPYCADLDLFGRGSLFELLCTARTRAGEETLADWLLLPAPRSQVRARQGAVADGRKHLDLREDLALLGGAVRAHVRPEVLTAWGSAAAVFTNAGALRAVAYLLAAAATASIPVWAYTTLGPLPLAVVAIIEWAVYRVARARTNAVNLAIQGPRDELNILATVLHRLEQESFTDPHALELQAQLTADGLSASEQIRRLEKLVTWWDAQRNQVWAIPAYLLMWNIHFSMGIDAWRTRSGPYVERWLRAMGELEALSALAGFAYEHPGDVFPEVTDGVPRISATHIGHPLLSPSACVHNDVELGDPVRVIVVSGSNMSGKSTLLRTVGINVVLALAGAPVRAKHMSLTPLQIGATLRVLDSLSDGKSRFYAEISRLRQIMDLFGKELPVLFLLDEILHGTNSHDRQTGAEAVVRSLIDEGAIGLVTTHDLALAKAVESLGARGRNVHFQDELVEGELVFDYTIREGVVTKSNAIALMRSVGLRV